MSFHYTIQTISSFQGCLESIQQWYRDHYFLFLMLIISMVCVEFFVILNIIYNCSRLQKKKQRNNEMLNVKRALQNELQLYSVPKKATTKKSAVTRQQIQHQTPSPPEIMMEHQQQQHNHHHNLQNRQNLFLNPSSKFSKNDVINQMYKPKDEFNDNQQHTRSYLV